MDGSLRSLCAGKISAGKTRVGQVAFLLGALTLAAIAPAQVLVESTFESGSDGWTTITTRNRSFTSGTSAFAGTNSSGTLVQRDPDDGVSYWRAPEKFAGGKSLALGGVLSFDLKQSATGNPIRNLPDLILIGGGRTLVNMLPRTPITRWQRYHMVLDRGAGWRVGTLGGPEATRMDLLATLSALEDIRIRAEFRGGGETNYLDNVQFTAHQAAAPRSTFDVEEDGWFVIGDVNALTWTGIGGNPSGFVRASDRGDGKYWTFQAPAKFLGDRSALYGQILTWDLATNRAEGKATGRPDAMLSGGGLTLLFDASSNPGTSFTNFTVALTESGGWRIGTVKGKVPTRAEFDRVLACITDIQLRGEFSGKLDTGSLDNVFLGLFAGGEGENEPCAADYDRSGMVDPDDLADFLVDYFTVPPGPRTDYNFNGVTNPDDLAGFINAYFIGCDGN